MQRQRNINLIWWEILSLSYLKETVSSNHPYNLADIKTANLSDAIDLLTKEIFMEVRTCFELNTQNVTESQGQKNDQWFSYLCSYKISQR